MTKVRIEMQRHGKGKVYLDDQEVDNVRGVYFSAAVNEVNCVLIHLVPNIIEVTSEETEVETKKLQKNCIVCGNPATKFKRDVIELPGNMNDIWKKYTNGLSTAYCEEHYKP